MICLMATGAVECAAIGQFCHFLTVEGAMTLDAVAAGNGLMHAVGCEIDVYMAFDADLGHGRTGHCRDHAASGRCYMPAVYRRHAAGR